MCVCLSELFFLFSKLRTGKKSTEQPQNYFIVLLDLNHAEKEMTR